MLQLPDNTGFINSGVIAQVIEDTTGPETPVLDEFFSADEQTLSSIIVNRKEVLNTWGPVPVTSRSGDHVLIDMGSEFTEVFMPLPFKPKSILLAEDVNNRLAHGENGNVDSLIKARVAKLYKSILTSMETLCKQAWASGSIGYAEASANAKKGYETYTCSFGATLTAPSGMNKNWGHADTTIPMIVADLRKITRALQAKHFGKKINLKLGDTLWDAVATKVEASVTTARRNLSVEVVDDVGVINLHGFILRSFSDDYYDIITDATVDTINTKNLIATVVNAPRAGRFLALDDADVIGSMTTDFFVKIKKEISGKGWDIYGQSKYLPMPVPQTVFNGDMWTAP